VSPGGQSLVAEHDVGLAAGLVRASKEIGALYDADRLDTGDEAIEQFGALVPTGGNALLAETVEDTTEPLDTFVAGMGGHDCAPPAG
jgi:hypothetical protein